MYSVQVLVHSNCTYTPETSHGNSSQLHFLILDPGAQ